MEPRESRTFRMPMPLDPEFMSILCCPAVEDGHACHGDLEETLLPEGMEHAEAGEPALPALRCRRCGRAYPIEDGIPVLLQDHARKVEP